MTNLNPFWRYYGGKWRAAPRYPKPVHATIVEPFAGAAGYSIRYYARRVILVEKHPVIAETWRYLIGVPEQEIRRIPCVEHVDDLPAWVPAGGRYIVGWWMNTATTTPRKRLSVGKKRLAALGRNFEGWTVATRERIAKQVGFIRHWEIIEGNYTAAPNIEATWFVDPPYNNSAGKHYPEHDLNYFELGNWCRKRCGQVLVCENEGATWGDFRSFATFKAGVNGNGSKEVLWELTG